MMFNSDFTADEAKIRRLERGNLDLDARLRAVEMTQARLADDANQQRPQNGGGGGGNWIGQTTSSIPALYGAGGMVKLTTLSLASPTASDPTQTDSGADPVKAYNGTGNAVPANKNCGGYFIGPYRVITWANCKNPTTADPAPAAAPSATSTTSTTSSPQGMTTNTDTFMTTDGNQPIMTA